VRKQLLSVTQWKIVLVTLGLIVLAVDIWGSTNWERVALPAKAGTLAVTLGSPDRDYRHPILGIDDGSPLLQAGAKPGDLLQFDRLGDSLRYLDTGETIGLSLYAGTTSRHLQLRPTPDPLIASWATLAKVNVLTNGIQIYITLLLAMLIGWRRADSMAMRVLAVILLDNSLDSCWDMLPSSPLQNVLVEMRPLSVLITYLGFAYFSVLYQNEQAPWRRAWVRRCFSALALGFSLICLAMIVHMFSALPWALREYVSINACKEWAAIVSVIFSLSMLGASWHASRGSARQKLAWAGVCMGLVYTSFLLYNVNIRLGQPVPMFIFNSVQNLTMLLGFGALAYAMLRHRLFDFGFVVNRVLVVTIVSGFLLVIFAFTEWGVDKLLDFEGREKNVIFDALVALGIILFFHRIQHWVSHQVDHLFFHQWYEAAEKLRHFLSKAALIPDAAALQSRFLRTLEDYAGTQGTAIYLRHANGNYLLQESSLIGAPVTIALHHELVIDLLHSRAPVELVERTHGLPGELGIPMMGRGNLQGLLLLNAKASGQRYRPDEIALLGSAVHQIGLDLESLRVQELESAVSDLAHKASSLEGKLKHAEQLAAAREDEARVLRQFAAREA